MGSLIEVKNVTRDFQTPGGKVSVLKGITCTIQPDTMCILRGKSGSGKTTLLNIIGALDDPTSGQILIDGNSSHSMNAIARENMRRRQMGFVFQSVSLIPSMNAIQNVEFAMRMAGIKEDMDKRAAEVLSIVGLSNRMTHMPQEMSGGEQQRVAIARAIAHHPRIILADEPTAELDSGMATEVTRLFKQISEEEHVTIIMTTHDVGLMGAGDQLIELKNGRIEGSGEDG
ncbi:MAG: ABC transporter ATP-binding protein [Lachnospiraceae bacterium]|nr:ABC transporter ATP-binding protein [Lachnospiraceae bacterium]MBP5253339.1 ABC transporter ATP-binding protein [Lachnospiraceae bacterium]